MLRNSGVTLDSFDFEEGCGVNLKTGEIGNMIEMGIVDPALVTKSALRNAVSVASTILSTKTIIHNSASSNAIVSAKKL